jgi:hypothetical protein
LILDPIDFGSAYHAFSVALHTLQDSTSPTHAGFQQWSDTPDPISVQMHVTAETATSWSDNSFTRANNMITSQAYYWFAVSKQLPSQNLFSDQLSGMGCECE